MKVLNLVREFERIQMKDSKSITKYLDKLIRIANKARALGTANKARALGTQFI